MSALVKLLHGTQRSDRAQQINRLLFENWGRSILLVPTRHVAERRTENIILDSGLDGCLGRVVFTFPDFVKALLHGEGMATTTVSGLERRLLLAQAISDLGQRGKLAGVEGIAQSPGFINHIERTITQLKQAAIEPEIFRERVARRQHSSHLDEILADVYEAYQSALHKANVYDSQGLYWQARVVCDERCPAFLSATNMLLIDEFDDFTPSEKRLLKSLSKHLEQIVFGLSYDQNPSARDLYAIPLRTGEDLRKDFGEMEIVGAAEEAPKTFSEFASSKIFWRDVDRKTEDLDKNITLQLCQGTGHEIETIGRRVKALLVDECVSPSEIAIVFRDLNEAAPTLRTVFDEFGIPLKIVNERNLTESSICAFIIEFFEATVAWQRDAVVDVLCSPWFSSAKEDTDAQEALPALTSAAKVFAGFDDWEIGFASLAESTTKDEESVSKEDVEDGPLSLENIEAARRLIGKLQKLSTDFPEKATLTEFADALSDFLRRLDLQNALDHMHPGPGKEFEAEAIKGAFGLLGSIKLWTQVETEAIERQDLLVILRQAMSLTTVKVKPVKNCVVCLDAESVRHLQYDYVFFGGVNDGEIPKPPAINAIYSEEDLADLAHVGVDLEDKELRAKSELLLFHHVMDVPRKRLYITWRTKSRTGKDVGPSPYLADLLELFDDAELEIGRMEPLIPAPLEAASSRDLRNALFKNAPEVAAQIEGLDNIRHGIEIENRRQSRKAFDEYDGVLGCSDIVGTIAEKFAEDHTFSVNQIETYKKCPFAFFCQRVLGVAEFEEAVFGIDPLTRGSLLHDILFRFHANNRGTPVPEMDDDEALRAMEQITASAFSGFTSKNLNIPEGVWKVEQGKILTQLSIYLASERDTKDSSSWKPSYFEAAFGRVKGDYDEPISTHVPFELKTEIGRVLFSGRIDRIDINGNSARIIDYKSGGLPAQKDVCEGRDIQLVLYALALEGLLLTDAKCESAFYVSIGKNKRAEVLKRNAKKNDWDMRRDATLTTVEESVTAIRQGHFPPSPSAKKACEYCAFGSICRHQAARIENKEAANASNS